MTPHEIIGLIIVLIVMLVGTIGTVLPILPGTPVILLAAIVHKLYFGPASAPWWIIAILAILAALSFVLDYVGQALGAKKLGATWKGITGAILGGLVGIFFSLPGIILGPFLGATVFELIGGMPVKPAAKAGAGAVLGIVIGAVGKISVCVAMMVLFTVAVVV